MLSEGPGAARRMDVTLRGNIMASRINRAIELLAQDQAIYYVGGHTGHPLTHDRGSQDARTWADYINIGMEHGSFDMAGFAEYLRGLVVGGPTRWASYCSASSWRAEGIAKCEEIIAVPGIGFAENGPRRSRPGARLSRGPARPLSAGDSAGTGTRLCSLSPAPRAVSRNLLAREHRREARRGSARRRGHREETAIIGRAHQKRTMLSAPIEL